jgi:hypothetical protein
MLCLSDSIRYDEPCGQPLLRRIEAAPTRAQLMLAVWPVARVLALHVVEYVLAERAQRPRAWPPCPSCRVPLRRKGFAQRQLMSLFGPIRWRRRVGRCPQGARSHRSPPSIRRWGGSHISGPVGNSSAWAVRARSLCHLLRRRGGGGGTVAAW